MISAKYDWLIPDNQPSDAFLEQVKKQGLTSEAGKVLYGRGIDTLEKLEDFLTTNLADLHDPFLLNDMDRAVERIQEAISQGQRILVYGDYDADGMTSASIVKEALDMLGADVQVYLPNRFTDGYGPNQSVYQYFIDNEQIDLIVTVDNGVSGHEALSYAKSVGVDVVVTDHHSLPDSLPEAYAIVHPEHPEADYPFQYLAGCGVAFKLAWALLGDLPTELLDLVAIGTVADMVSLTGENRILVKAGLQILKQTERFGLQELLRLAEFDSANVTEETIGFTLAPQLNALGRLDDPNPAIELLTGFDDEEASQIALMLQEKNEERKVLVQTIYDEALSQIKSNQPIQVLAKEGWHPGVLGIVAGRLLENLGQPVIVLGIEAGLAKGSGRSPEGVNLFEAMTACKDLFEAFGGHSGAAGMTLKEEQLVTLQEKLSQYMFERGLDKLDKPKLQIDAELDLSQLSLDTIKSLDKLSPFGMNHKKPVFLLSGMTVSQARTMGQENRHLKLRLNQAGVDCDLIAFNQGHLAQEFQQAQGLELAVTLSVNQWNGQTSLQLYLEDARVNGVQLFDIRSKAVPVPPDVPLITADSHSRIVLVDTIPNTMEELAQAFAGRSFDAIYFKNTIINNYYMTGYGTREQFARLYKTIYQYPEFDVRYKLKELETYLKIPVLLLVKMIQIFEELGFVSIDNGVMRVIKDAPKREIASSQIYQDLKALVAFQELMTLGSPQDIYASIQQHLALMEQ